MVIFKSWSYISNSKLSLESFLNLVAVFFFKNYIWEIVTMCLIWIAIYQDNVDSNEKYSLKKKNSQMVGQRYLSTFLKY